MIDTKSIESIEFRDLSFGYDQTLLFEKSNFQLEKGKIFHLSSASGAGKSAVLRLLAGLVLPSSGEYLLNGLSVGDMSFEEFLPYRLCFGFSFDLGGLLNNRTIRENLTLPLEYHKRFTDEEIKRRCELMLRKFDLVAAADRRPSSVSGSQRKACVVARSLIIEPQVLLLDDPTTGLGESAARELVHTIGEYVASGKTRFVVIATDDKAFLNQMSVERLDIRQGKISLRGLEAA